MLLGKISRHRMTYFSAALSVMEIVPPLVACEFSQRDVCVMLHQSDFIQQI
jgi:hypothetical protein